MELRDRLREARSIVDKTKGKIDLWEFENKKDQERIERLKTEYANTDKAIEIVHTATETRRQELRDRVESLVTRGLRAVFKREDFEFLFKVSLRRDVFGVLPVLKSKFGEHDLEEGIVDGHGGGVADVVSFILRVIILSLSRPRVAPLMILDESFKHVSPQYLRGVSVLLKELSDTAGIQFIMVTHKSELLDSADVIYRSSLDKKGITNFEMEHCLRDEIYHAPETAKELKTHSLFAHEPLTKSEGGTTTMSSNPDWEAEKQRYRSRIYKYRKHRGILPEGQKRQRAKKKTKKRRKKRK